MKNWKKALISSDSNIYRAMELMDKETIGIALVVDEKQCLLGTVSDGDVCRAFLKGIDYESKVVQIMNKDFRFLSKNDRYLALKIMKNERINFLPVLNEQGQIISLLSIHELFQEKKENWVLIMAGGMGTRLRPLTEKCPKPLLSVGGKPVIETIVEHLIEQGFSKFFISVKYKAEMIKEYFGDGSALSIQIKYLEEKSSLGTAGALGLIPDRPEKPLLMINGDILCKVNFVELLDFHDKNKAQVTMGIREYSVKLPYGVVSTNKDKLHAIEEKPVRKFYINAGIYVFEPAVIEQISLGSYLDIPDLLRYLQEEKKEIAAFPIRDYWIDIGNLEDYARANAEFPEVFG